MHECTNLKSPFPFYHDRRSLERDELVTYEETWKVLSDLLIELRKKGAPVPSSIVEDLRSAKTMIQVLKADPKYVESVPRVETFLGNVEAHLISMAQERFGSSFADTWMERVKRARGTVRERGETASRFVPGLPKGEHWVRIKISEDAPREVVEMLAEEQNLVHKMQKGGYILVSGDSEDIKSFVKAMAGKFRGTRKR